MRRSCHVSQNAAETTGLRLESHSNVLVERKATLEERWWAANNILWGQQHSIPNAFAIVQNTPMRQARRLGGTGRARSKLYISNFFRMQFHIQDYVFVSSSSILQNTIKLPSRA